MDWKNKFEDELGMADAARGRGNEGQARVCARRAAGVVVREYFQRIGRAPSSSSAYDALNELLTMEVLPIRARQAAEALTQRVTDQFRLPDNLDLLSEARALAASLLPKD
jgi:hypothetical protein